MTPWNQTSSDAPRADPTRAPAVKARASLGRRALGRLIDTAIFFGTGSIMGSVAYVFGGPPHLGMSMGFMIVLALQALLLTARSQSIGKSIMRTMIVDRQGHPAGFTRSFVMRELPLLVLRIVPPARFLFFLDGLFIFTRSRRCLHDYFAGTHVVDVATVETSH